MKKAHLLFIVQNSFPCNCSSWSFKALSCNFLKTLCLCVLSPNIMLEVQLHQRVNSILVHHQDDDDDDDDENDDDDGDDDDGDDDDW